MESKDADCIEFFPGLLNALELPSTRVKLLQCLHSVMKNEAEDPQNQCEMILQEIDKMDNLDVVAYFIIVRELATALNKIEKHEESLDLVKKRLTESSKDFWLLLVLGRIEEESGNYNEALHFHELAKTKAESDEHLKLAVANSKIAVDKWQLNISPSIVNCIVAEVKESLCDLQKDRISLKNVNSEKATLFLDVYKTLAYIDRIQERHLQSIDSYEKVLAITSLEPKAYIHLLKSYTQLSAQYTYKTNEYASHSSQAERYINKAKEIMENVLLDANYVAIHTDSMIHAISRIAHAYQNMKQNQKALEIRLRLLDLIKQYLGDSHPETARAASDTALLYHLMKDSAHSDEYISITEDALEECNYKNDIIKSKLYIRELSDALRNLGNIFTFKADFCRAEQQYRASLDLNIKVYGEQHQRLARVYRGMGHLYMRWRNTTKALESFHKCRDIHVLYLPQSQDILSKIDKDIQKAHNPNRRYR